MATTYYLERIAFLDGQVLHDFHLNSMQRNIAEAMKRQMTTERYDMRLLVSPYQYYFMEPFIDNKKSDPSTTAQINNLTFSINSGQWVTPLLQLPSPTDEFMILATIEDYPEYNAIVKFHYRLSEIGQWQEVKIDQPVYLSTPTRYLQIKAECLYETTVRPVLYDFAVLWK